MNKIKISKKDAKENYFIIGIGFGKAQNLLAHEKPIAYSTTGHMGWLCDYYDIEGVVISTGASYLENKNTNTTYAMIKSYDDKARLIIDSVSNYEQQKKAVRQLLSEFVNKALADAKGIK
jgi:hypothetical protein